MGVDRVVNVMHRELGGLGHRQFADQLRGFRSDNVRPENLPEASIADDLHEAVRFSSRHGLAVRGERESTDLHLVTRAERLLLGQTDRCHLRLTVDARRDAGVIDRRGAQQRAWAKGNRKAVEDLAPQRADGAET